MKAIQCFFSKIFIFIGLISFSSFSQTLKLPEFSISAGSVPVLVEPGYTLQTTCKIYNKGTATGSYFSIGYYLSQDAVQDASDIFMGASAFNNVLAIGGNASFNFNYYVSPTQSKGTYYIIYVVDYLNQVYESNETNNKTTSASFLIDKALYDMKISSVYDVSPTFPGNSSPVYFKIQNSGNATINNMAYVRFYLSTDNKLGSDVLLDLYTASPLDPSTVEGTVLTSVTIPSSVLPGEYFLIAVADPNNYVVETDETNNRAYTPFTVLSKTVDFSTQLAATSYIVTPGNSLTVNATLKNNGNTASAISKIGYYLSTDNTFDAADELLGFYNAASVNPVGSIVTSGSATIPADKSNGPYYIIIYADYLNTVIETDETNNYTVVPLTLSDPVTDLSISTPGAPLTAIVGTSITLTCSVINSGSTLVSSSNAGFYLSEDAILDANDVLLTSSTAGSMAGGAISTRSVSATIPANKIDGNYFILYVADPTQLLTESDETNNVVSKSISLTPRLVDLNLTTATSANPVATSGNTFSVTATITNTGNAFVYTGIGFYLSTDTIFDTNDVLIGSTAPASVYNNTPSAKTGNVTIPANTAEGSYYILFYADYQNVIAEVNETNNYLYKPLIISTIYLMSNGTNQITTCSGYLFDSGGSGYAYSNNENSTLTIYPGTPGSKVKLEFNRIYYFTDYDYLKIYDGTSTSAPLRSSTAEFTNPGIIYGTSASGALTIVFKSDASYTGTGFGARISCVSTLPTIDLFFENTSAPATNIAGTKMAFGYTSRNKGILDATDSSVKYYLSKDTVFDVNDQDLGFTGVGELKAGLSFTQANTAIWSVEPTTPAGNYYLLFYIDYMKYVAESDETNNIVWKPIIILGPGMDLTPSLPKAPTKTLTGTDFTVSCVVTNVGIVTTGTSKIGYYLSLDKTLDGSDVLLASSDINTLVSSQKSTVSSILNVPASTLQGDYYILYVTDYDKQITETQETNNLAYAPITITVTFAATISSPSTSFCKGKSILLTASNGTAFKWFNGTTEVGSTQTYEAKSAGSYTVEVTNSNGEKATSTIREITVNEVPTAAITSPSTSFCKGGNVDLTASVSTSYKWFNGLSEVGTSQIYTASIGGSYTVEISNANGCKDTSEAITIIVNDLPSATITSPSTSFCEGESILLTAHTGNAFKWFNGATEVGLTQTYEAKSAGSYTVEVTNAANCKNISSAIEITETTPTIWYSDLDNDKKGDPNTTQTSCIQPVNYVAVAGDKCPSDVNKIEAGNCGCGKTEQSCIDCANVINGTAALDICNVCSGGTTHITPKTTLNECIATGLGAASGIEYVSIYPNPFENTIHVDTKGRLLNLHVYDPSGQLLETIQVEGENQIGEQWKSGMYLIRYSVDQTWYQMKIIKR